jgi:DNA-binding NarL/FixJ family response regulator
LAAAKGAKILVLTGLSSPEEHYRAVRLGAMGIVTKGEAPEMLLCAIESVCAGEVWLEQGVTARIFSELIHDTGTERQDPEADRIARLTTRERGIIALVGDGLKNKQIADRLNISEVTVRHHLTSVFSKLKVSDRLGLALYAYQFGLAKLPYEAHGRSSKGTKNTPLLQVNN